MKIAIPVEMISEDVKVCPSFGRAPYFLIYDTNTKVSEFINNNGATITGGAGIKAAQKIVDNSVNALLAPRCGENAAEVIASANIKIYKTLSTSVKDNIDAFIDAKLPLLHEIHSGFHGHGEKSI